MKTALPLFCSLLFAGCSSNIGNDIAAGFHALTPVERPDKNELNAMVSKIVEEMLSNNLYVTSLNTIAVASITNLDDLASTNRLGNQLSEGIIHYLHESGFKVVDFKLTGNISVTPEGDFVQSRDWSQLQASQPVDYLVTGNMDKFADGINVSVRMVGLQSHIVVGSAQAFIPHNIVQALDLSDEPDATALNATDSALMNLDKTPMMNNGAMHESGNSNRQVTLKNGLIVRHSSDVNTEN